MVTSDGTIFTFPGFEEKQEDGSLKFYITAQGHYYTVIKKSDKTESLEERNEANPITAEDFKKIYGVDKNYNVVTESKIYKENLEIN